MTHKQSNQNKAY